MAHAELHDLHAYATSRMPLDLAREMAQSEDGEILLISGAIPMDIGYPDDEHKDIIQLVNLSTANAPSIPSNSRKVALYRILNRRRLHEVVDYMQDHGGYRCQLIKSDGTLDPGYYL